MAHQLTPRGKCMHWLSTHRHITEEPPGSNSDHRKDGIHAAEVRLANGATFLVGQPWCGTWAGNGLLAAGVHGVSSRQASVSLIEDDARARRAPYTHGWTLDPKKVLRGDHAVLFGRGIHVETVRQVFPRLGYIVTDGGNTTSGAAGDQANGGGSFRRIRRISDVHGFALVNYPDGQAREVLDTELPPPSPARATVASAGAVLTGEPAAIVGAIVTVLNAVQLAAIHLSCPVHTLIAVVSIALGALVTRSKVSPPSPVATSSDERISKTVQSKLKKGEVVS